MSQALPPKHDMDAEAAVLSALLLQPELLCDVDPVLSPGQFYSQANRRIAEAIWSLDDSGERIDVVSVASWLQARGLLDQAGGSPYLAQVQDATPAIAHVENHARIVRDLASVRTVQALLGTLRAESTGPMQDAQAWLQSVEARIFEATQQSDRSSLVTLQEVLRDEHDRIAAPAEELDPNEFIRTDMPTLNDLLDGGMERGGVYLVGARPGHGKTALALQTALRVARTGEGVHFASLEMPREQLGRRAISQLSGVSSSAIKRRELGREEWQKIADGVMLMQRYPMTIDDMPKQGLHELRSGIRRAMKRMGKPRMGLVVVDYVQLMNTRSIGNGNRDQELGEVSRGLAAAAKEFKCPFMVLAQLNRDIEKRKDKRPLMSDLRECGSFEADAYGILFVYREDVYRDASAANGDAEIIIGKQRSGRIGTVDCRYSGDTTTFYEEHPADDIGFTEYEDR